MYITGDIFGRCSIRGPTQHRRHRRQLARSRLARQNVRSICIQYGRAYLRQDSQTVFNRNTVAINLSLAIRPRAFLCKCVKVTAAIQSPPSFRGTHRNDYVSFLRFVVGAQIIGVCWPGARTHTLIYGLRQSSADFPLCDIMKLYLPYVLGRHVLCSAAFSYGTAFIYHSW